LPAAEKEKRYFNKSLLSIVLNRLTTIVVLVLWKRFVKKTLRLMQISMPYLISYGARCQNLNYPPH